MNVAPRPKYSDTRNKLAGNFNRARIAFIKIDLDSAITFTKVARIAEDAEIRDRNIANAWKAHDTVQRYMAVADLSREDVAEIENKILRLKAALVELSHSQK